MNIPELLLKAADRMEAYHDGMEEELRAAAEEMEQEPVAYGALGSHGIWWACGDKEDIEDDPCFDPDADEIVPLYRHPAPVAPAVPEPVEVIDGCDDHPVDARMMGYSEGWNDCREAMLSASPEPDDKREADTVTRDVISRAWMSLGLERRPELSLCEFHKAIDTAMKEEK